MPPRARSSSRTIPFEPPPIAMQSNWRHVGLFSHGILKIIDHPFVIDSHGGASTGAPEEGFAGQGIEPGKRDIAGKAGVDRRLALRQHDAGRLAADLAARLQ